MKQWAEKFYQSTVWKRCRNLYIQNRINIDGGLCERCHKKIGYIVHHKIYLTQLNIANPSISLSLENLEYLCHQCHDIEHLNANHLRVDFNADGDVLPPSNTNYM